ncbi:hypothetical protein L1987_17977 [Smallanthus sonchifolius]|uniref:Uncharacterized protein n=1 Tax=Smallanthus sonchifolius TaxID=185202 RepID=A0ACB9IZI6_9ASTR|nr:hypothetical protein L1987_17977 [Smallanthus sonchifolius]
MAAPVSDKIASTWCRRCLFDAWLHIVGLNAFCCQNKHLLVVDTEELAVIADGYGGDYGGSGGYGGSNDSLGGYGGYDFEDDYAHFQSNK